jgi:hypothetical protein
MRLRALRGSRGILGLADTWQVLNKEESAKVEKATGSISRGVCILAAVAAVLALAPAAFAQTGTGYGGTAGGTAGQVQGGSGGNQGAASPSVASEPAETDSSGVLAFTGLDVALIAGGGFVLLVGGVGLSRLVARNPA